MFVKAGNKITNLVGCTSIANKSGKLTVFYGDKAELIGTYSDEKKADENLNKIFNALDNNSTAIVLDD